MDKLRTYGNPPFRVAVVHGGPGAQGEMAPVARRLSLRMGVLEPMQNEFSIDAQAEELRWVLERNAELPAALVGWSWGAWLAYIVTARYTHLVKKLVLVSSGPFLESYAADIMRTRLERLEAADREEVLSLQDRLSDPGEEDADKCLARYGELMNKADAYDPLPGGDEGVECRRDVNDSVWKEAVELRRSGRLLQLGRNIKCKVVAVHGDHDPHPAAGVLGPLSEVIDDLRFILLENCGHCPWLERQAADLFFSLLTEELEE